MQLKSLDEIRALSQKIAADMNIEIVDVEFDNRTDTLTVYIETEGGVDLDTCEKFHNAINEPLDGLDPSGEGVLTDFDENSVTVKIGREELKISRNKIAKINKAIKFE